MRITFLLIALLTTASFSQTKLPLPSQIQKVDTGYVYQATVIGDYDGDGKKDLLVVFGRPVQSNFGVCIYSYSKGEYLLQLHLTELPIISYGNLTGSYSNVNTEIVELIVNNTIYSYNSSMVKKKT
jgi:hypothetical protein